MFIVYLFLCDLHIVNTYVKYWNHLVFISPLNVFYGVFFSLLLTPVFVTPVGRHISHGIIIMQMNSCFR